MFEIRRYTADDRKSWDGYVRRARNATFLFERNYMEYHADRFDDWSLMFYRQGRLYALLPAHRRDTRLSLIMVSLMADSLWTSMSP